MYGRKCWTIKKAECQRIDAFELWCWRRLLRAPWTAKRSNQSILKEINPEYSLDGLMLKLKFQYFGHLMWRANSLEKTLMLGRVGGRRRRGWQRMRWMDGWHHQLDGDEFGWTPGVGDGQGGLVCCSALGHKESAAIEWLNNNCSYCSLQCRPQETWIINKIDILYHLLELSLFIWVLIVPIPIFP